MARVPRPLPAHEVDLLVIGAGINGAGIARDAAMRGLSVVLVDKGDIGSGTTSWSTRLIHGGLRYLEHFELGLVRESLREREALLRTAAHLVNPLSFFIPIYAGDERGPLMVRAGMLAYDTLSFGKLGRHHMLNATEAREREPGVEEEGLRGAAVYFDAQAEFPERVAVENALSAHDHGATVLTHHRVERLLVDGGRARGAEVADGDGNARPVRARVTLNVAGPWVDEVLGPVGGAEPLIGGTKGSHIVVRTFPGAPSEALYVEADDGRPYFIVPWNDLFLIGTTDTRYDGDLDRVEATREEIDYLVGETNKVIPAADLSPEDVLYTYAGVRPLPYAPDGDEGSVTRSHVVHDHAPAVDGLLSIVGGKLTTFRALAEDAVDAVVDRVDGSFANCRTREEPLPGAATEDFAAFRAEWASDERRERLADLYGVRAPGILERAEAGDGDLLAAEVAHALEEELAVTLEDILMRRTMLGLGADAGIGPDEHAAEAARTVAGWSAERAAAELAAYRDRVRRVRPGGTITLTD